MRHGYVSKSDISYLQITYQRGSLLPDHLLYNNCGFQNGFPAITQRIPVDETKDNISEISHIIQYLPDHITINIIFKEMKPPGK